MLDLIRRLSPRGELVLIAILCMAGLSMDSLVEAVHPASRHVYDNFHVGILVAADLVFGGLALAILRIRRFPLRELGWKLDLRLTGIGVLLFIVFFVDLGTIVGAYMAVVKTKSSHHSSHTAAPALIILMVALVPLFEETFTSAYLVRRLDPRGGLAILTAVGMHAASSFSSPSEAFGAGLFGLMTVVAYWRWRQLWPLVLARMILYGIIFGTM